RGVVVQQHRAAVRLYQADDHVERRRLSGAVRAQQADDFAGAYFGAHAVDDGPLSVAFEQTAHFDFLHYLTTICVSFTFEVNVVPVSTSCWPPCSPLMRTCPSPC